MTAQQQQLVALWDSTLEARVGLLAHEDLEVALLRPLTAMPAAALALVDHLSSSDQPLARRSAATLVGLLGAKAPSTLLGALFKTELERQRDATTEDLKRAAAAVIDALVRAATRWSREPSRKALGLELLATRPSGERQAVEQQIIATDQRCDAVTFSDEGREVIAQWHALSAAVDTSAPVPAPSA